MTRRLFAAGVLFAALFTPARAAAVSDPSAVSHDCMNSDTTSTGLRVVVCIDGHIYEHDPTPIYGIKIEYICADRYGQVQCSGVKGLGQEYVSPYGWIGNLHRYTCGAYADNHLPCANGRNFDNYVDLIAVKYNQTHHWVGQAWNVTINNRGSIFLVKLFRGLDYTTIPS